MQWIVILGMHRSGTSALAGELCQQGVCFGDTFIDEIEEVNQKGFYEHKELVEINELILVELGKSWFDCFNIHTQLEGNWLPSPSIIERMKAFLCSDEFSDQDICGLKDPRLSLLLPIWINVFDSLGIKPNFVIVNRNPDEIVASLNKRDAMPSYLAELLWYYYTVLSAFNTFGYRTAWIESSDLFHSPVIAIEKIFKSLLIEKVVSRAYFVDENIPKKNHKEPTNELYLALQKCESPLQDYDFKLEKKRMENKLCSESPKIDLALDCFYTINRIYTQAVENGSNYTKATEVIAERDSTIIEQLRTIELQRASLEEQRASLEEKQQIIYNYEQKFVNRVINYLKRKLS